MLRRQYPADQYDITEKNKKLAITPKRVVIRAFNRQIKALNVQTKIDPYTDLLLELVKDRNLQPEDFIQCQITVRKELGNLLAKEAKRCGTRKIIYLQQLLSGVNQT